MLLIPAIDIKDGRCVRLRQGAMDDATVFSEDPVAMAVQWADLGARRLHLVDLDGAVDGKPKNETVIREIVDAVGDDVPVQLGGGIRDLDTMERYLDDGLSFLIIGTAAVRNPGRPTKLSRVGPDRGGLPGVQTTHLRPARHPGAAGAGVARHPGGKGRWAQDQDQCRHS